LINSKPKTHVSGDNNKTLFFRIILVRFFVIVDSQITLR